MKKIVHISEVSSGGILPFIADIANNLINEYESYVIYGIRFDTPSNIEEYFNPGIHLIPLSCFKREISFGKDLETFIKIKALIREIAPDIVHLHSSKAGVVGRWAINGKKIDLFYSPHCYSFLKEDDGKIKRRIYWMIEWITARRCCTTIAGAKGELYLTKKLGAKAVLAQNGIETKILDQSIKNLEKKEHPFTVYTAGRIGPQKNPELFNEIARRCPNVRFVWVGDGSERYKLSSPNIFVTGLINREKQFEFFYNADIFILCSKWESAPCSILNAMYLKKICIVSDIVGNKDLVQEGVNGYVCKNADDFAEIINNFDKYDTEKIKRSAYDGVVGFYNAQKMSERMRNVYTMRQIYH